jgi:hypothetical protein
MSRINRPPVLDGDAISASDLNDRYSDYTQTDINEFNTRDAAVDLPQFERDNNRGFLAKVGTSVLIGKQDFYHAAPVTLNGLGTAPSAAYVIGDGVADTVLGPLGAGLAVVDDTNILRVYWSLNVRPQFTGTPWTTSSTPSAEYQVPHTSAGSTGVATNATCWALYLQWDVTSAALTNWTEVPYQGDFTANPTGTLRGSLLENTAATSVVPAWTTRHDAVDREATGAEVANPIGWRGVSGHYFYTTAMGASVTVYGLRLVVKGPMHPFNFNGRNYLVQQPDIVNGANVTLQHTVGRLGFIINKVK